jgi:hypothetical protein
MESISSTGSIANGDRLIGQIDGAPIVVAVLSCLFWKRKIRGFKRDDKHAVARAIIEQDTGKLVPMRTGCQSALPPNPPDILNQNHTAPES